MVCNCVDYAVSLKKANFSFDSAYKAPYNISAWWLKASPLDHYDVSKTTLVFLAKTFFSKISESLFPHGKNPGALLAGLPLTIAFSLIASKGRIITDLRQISYLYAISVLLAI